MSYVDLVALADKAKDNLGSFHDMQKWEEYNQAEADVEEFEGRGGARSGGGDDEVRQRLGRRKNSTRVLEAMAPILINDRGTALSLVGVAAVSAVGAVACHSIRLLVREALELAVGLQATRAADALESWRTFELYILSFLHSSAWVAFGAQRLLQRNGWDHDGGGATRALCLSSGYHMYAPVQFISSHPIPSHGSSFHLIAAPRLSSHRPLSSPLISCSVFSFRLLSSHVRYVLLTLKSIWTHPLVTLHQLGELVRSLTWLDLA
jgi:hypothetical protein